MSVRLSLGRDPMRRPLRATLAALAAIVVILALAACERAPTAQSVVLVVIDTLRADHVGALGGTPDHTPRISAWSKRGAAFSKAESTAPFTMPSVAALMTGVYPDRARVVEHRSGVTLAAYPGQTLAEAAKASGLRTAAIVSNPWLARPSCRFDRGFDSFASVYGRPAKSGGATEITDRALAAIDGFGDQRFFLWVHYFDPHMPYTPPPDYAREAGAPRTTSEIIQDFAKKKRDLARIYLGRGYDEETIATTRALYAGEVRFADAEVGRLLEAIDRKGLASSTLVVVASDHGESLGEHGLYFAHDYTVYEELTRAVLLMAGPGVQTGPRDDLVSLIDVAPTICRLAGLTCDGGFDGIDLLEDAPNQPTRTVFAAATPTRPHGIPFPRLTVKGLEGRWTMARRGDHKLVRIPAAGEPILELFDLAGDPGETQDLAAGDPVRSQLAAELERWHAEMNAIRSASPPTEEASRARDEKTLRSLGYIQ